MIKKRAKILQTRTFGFIIALTIVTLVILLNTTTTLLLPLELSTLDSHFYLKEAVRSRTVQEGSVYAERNLKTSEDILIVGIDLNSLTKYGKWPFDRTRHADLINAFSRIKDETKRENALLLDIFFVDPDPEQEKDKLLAAVIASSKRVYLETVLSLPQTSSTGSDNLEARTVSLYEAKGTLTRISGSWKEMPEYLGSEPPLLTYGMAARGFGHANFQGDRDEKYRRQPLVAKSSILLNTIQFNSLASGFSINEDVFERLAWMDKEGFWHNVKTPLDEASLRELGKELKKKAPAKMEDRDNDGIPETEVFLLRHFKDYFIPSITLALALNYFGKTCEDADIVLGKRIRIEAPSRFDPESGKRVPYQIQVTMDKFDEQGNLVKEGMRHTLPFIEIPIDKNGCMLVNYMGRPSSDTPEGPQTFPVRSYSGYAEKAPSADPSTWRRSLAAGNKILMVGAFAKGVASDEKPTPLGLMYGIEIHANALNTIIMNNFIRRTPIYVDLLLIIILVFLVAFMSSRLSTILSLFGTLFLVILFFFGSTFIFEYRSLLLDSHSPIVAMIFTFVAIVVYRAMTEERDKRMIRETFGKYVSPHVVDQLVENPPELGGIDKQLTVLFSDIRGFTTLSESMSPQELVNHLNLYLTAMTDIILEYGGTLDKYVGDEVMCFWGAPLPQEDHAVLACKCALRQMQKLRELNADWPEPIRINIGIGLNSGTMTVGNVGSPLRMNYTLMGDNVNLGARLEGTNKEYGTNIIISEFTYGLVYDKFIVRELDNIRVKGKNKPVMIYELVDCLEQLASPTIPPQKSKKLAENA